MASEARADPLSSIRAANAFPGRTRLRTDEIAGVLRISQQQVVDLLRSGELVGVTVNESGEVAAGDAKTPRGKWRVPVEEYEAFLERRRNR